MAVTKGHTELTETVLQPQYHHNSYNSCNSLLKNNLCFLCFPCEINILRNPCSNEDPSKNGVIPLGLKSKTPMMGAKR